MIFTVNLINGFSILRFWFLNWHSLFLRKHNFGFVVLRGLNWHLSVFYGSRMILGSAFLVPMFDKGVVGVFGVQHSWRLGSVFTMWWKLSELANESPSILVHDFTLFFIVFLDCLEQSTFLFVQEFNPLLVLLNHAFVFNYFLKVILFDFFRVHQLFALFCWLPKRALLSPLIRCFSLSLFLHLELYGGVLVCGLLVIRHCLSDSLSLLQVLCSDIQSHFAQFFSSLLSFCPQICAQNHLRSLVFYPHF